MRIVRRGDEFRFEVRNKQDAKEAVKTMKDYGADKAAFFHLRSRATICRCPIKGCAIAIKHIFLTPQTDIAIRPTKRLA